MSGRRSNPRELLDTSSPPERRAGAPVSGRLTLHDRSARDRTRLATPRAGDEMPGQLRLRDALAYLRQAIDAPVPLEALARLDAVQPTRRDRFVHWAGGRRNGLLGGLPHAVALHARATAGQGVVATVVGLPRSLRDAWGLDHVYDVPGHAFRKGWRRLSPAANSGGMNLLSR